jgi:hypothetical protein
LKPVVHHIFQRAGSTAVIRSFLLLDGDVTTSYQTLESIINTLYHRQITIHAITSRVTDNQLRNFLDTIVLVRLHLNPETVFIGDIEQFAYQVSIVGTIDHPDNSGYLMISQIKETPGTDDSDLLHMVILDAKSANPRSKITGQFRQVSNGNRWNVEAVFSSEIFRIFSDDFRPVPAGKHRKLTGIQWP